MSPRVFISYSLKDADACERVVGELRAAGADVWYAEDMEAGPPLSRTIEAQLRKSDVLIVLITPNSIKSEWVEAETSFFLGLRSQDAHRTVISIRLQECEVPFRLDIYKWVDFVGQSWSAGMDQVLRALGLDTGRASNRTNTVSAKEADYRMAQTRVLEGARSSVLCVRFGQEGHVLAAGLGDGGTLVWEMPDGRPRSIAARHSHELSALAFSTDGRLLATASYDCTARIWAMDSGDLVQTLQSHSEWLSSVVFSPDGRLLATASADRTAKLWDVATGTQVATLSGHHGYVHAVDFSPDGRLLATASYDQTAKLWDVASGVPILTLAGHLYGVQSVGFCPGADLIATGSVDRTIRIWSYKTGDTMAVLLGHKDTVRATEWHPNKQILATGSEDSTVRLWEVHPT